MIESIKEINFPQYATLSQATVVLNDMGDRTITADVKIDGAVSPDFSYDWEIEFKGERYIQPLRKPYALKDDKSSRSTISLTFYHWAIYQLKRDFFVELASTQAGTAFADKYVSPLAVNLGEFVTAFNNVLSYYFPDKKIYAVLNPDWEYDPERKYVDISYSYLWDVLQRTHELFGVRWTIEKDNSGNYAIRFGYPAGELTHIFEYGFKGGLLKVERQVQDTNIRNKILGRGGSQNLPYLYFKDYDKYPSGGDGNQGMIPDPDAIPELSNIYFSELRDSNFRSYIQGWKSNPNRILAEGDVVEPFDAERAESDYAYMRGATDEKFDPVEYVKDDESIAEYGELVGKIENNEDIFPTIQGMEIEIKSPDGISFLTRADEIVAVEEVITDMVADELGTNKDDISIDASQSYQKEMPMINESSADKATVSFSSPEFDVPEGYEATLFDNPILLHTVEIKERIRTEVNVGGNIVSKTSSSGLKKVKGDGASIAFKVIDVLSGKDVVPKNLPEGRYRIDYIVNIPEVSFGLGEVSRKNLGNGAIGIIYRERIDYIKHLLTASANVVCKSFNGDVILNKKDGAPISSSVALAPDEARTITIIGDDFEVPEQGAILIDVPISVTPKETSIFTEKTIKVINASTNEVLPSIDVPQGQYKLMVEVKLINKSSEEKVLIVELLPAYLYFVDKSEKWQPTFDVWIKNIFNTSKSDYLSEEAYVEGVWSPLRTEEDMVLTFSSGNLSGHDNWEFRIKKDGIAYDNSKTIIDARGNEVRSEWRLTLIKSDAEIETIKKYIPYKDFNAKAGDFFFFTGIFLPHQYVLSAEKELTSYKADNLAEVKDIKPQWVVSLDKIRAYQGGAERLVNSLSLGSVVTLRDKRFTKDVGERQVLQSITYDWQEGVLLPSIDVVLSDKITTSLSSVAMLQGKVESLAKQVGGLSNLEQIVRKFGDLLYLRKDGFEDTSFSPTKFADTVSSQNFRPGAIGGSGWGAYTDENGSSVIEADKLFIRNEMQVNSLIVNQIAALGGTKILSAADMTVSRVETVVLEDDVVGERCYFETKGASKANLFAVDDIAYSNMFDSENKELKYYKRRVIETGPDYITLSTIDKDGEGAPQEGDVIVQFGNFTDATRQSFIIIDPLNGGKIEVYAGVDSFNLTGCNMTGLGVNPTTQEAFLYGYGDMFFGDRKLESDFITYQKKAGETKRSLNINATVNFSSDSTGLSNLEEWKGVQSEISGINKTIERVQDQIDGVVENWNGEGTPTLTNEPAVNWLTDAEKIAHINDTYINIEEYVDDETTPTAGQAWRWCKCTNESITNFVTVTDKDGETFNLHWHPIADSDAVRALKELATKADKSDLEVLTKNLKDGSTIVDGGLVMTSMVAVGSANESKIEAFLNGSDFARIPNHYGKLILASGIPDTTASGSTDLAERAKEARTRLYENGVFDSDYVFIERGFLGQFYADNRKLKTNSTFDSQNVSILVLPTATSTDSPCGLGFRNLDSTDGVDTKVSISSKTNQTRYDLVDANKEVSGNMVVQFRHGLSSEVESSGSTKYDYLSAFYVSCQGTSAKEHFSVYCPAGQFAGLRPRTLRNPRTGGYTDRYTLSNLDHTIVIEDGTNATFNLYLPTTPEIGQHYEILKIAASRTINVQTTDGKKIHRIGNASAQTSQGLTVGWGGKAELTWDGVQWIMHIVASL